MVGVAYHNGLNLELRSDESGLEDSLETPILRCEVFPHSIQLSKRHELEPLSKVSLDIPVSHEKVGPATLKIC